MIYQILVIILSTFPKLYENVAKKSIDAAMTKCLFHFICTYWTTLLYPTCFDSFARRLEERSRQ